MVSLQSPASFFLAAGCQCVSESVSLSGFTVSETNGLVQVNWNGKFLSAYHFREVSRPFLYPLLGPDDVHLTRRWPQEPGLNEEHDHPHHHALWWAHGDVNGDDFWSESPKAGRTVHQHFTQLTGGRRAVIAARNKWINKEGKVVAEDERRLIFYPPIAELRTMDFEITVFAGKQDLVLGDTKEGTMAIRLAETMRLVRGDKSLGQGKILNAAGDRDQATWGKRAAWCDYSGPVEGGIYGVTMLDHPTNPVIQLGGMFEITGFLLLILLEFTTLRKRLKERVTFGLKRENRSPSAIDFFYIRENLNRRILKLLRWLSPLKNEFPRADDSSDDPRSAVFWLCWLQGTEPSSPASHWEFISASRNRGLSEGSRTGRRLCLQTYRANGVTSGP